MNENSLNNKLNRIDETLLVMKNNLGLSNNEVIENLATATNLHSLANIFIQEEEPSIKDGIWIQAKKETHPYDTIRIDGDIIIPGEWRFDHSETLSPNNKISLYCTDYQNYMYFIGANNGLYEYDFNSKQVKTLVPSQAADSNSVSGMTTDGEHIFVWGNMDIYKYDREGTRLNVFSCGVYPYCMCKSKNSPILYVISERAIHTYNTTTKEVAQIGSVSNSSYFRNAILLDDTRILLLGSTHNWGIYNGIFDLTTNSYTSISSLDRIFGLSQGAVAGVYGGSVYTFVLRDETNWKGTITKGVFKINLLDFSYEDLTEQFFNGDFSELLGFSFVNGSYYALDYNTSTLLIPQDSTSVQYDDSSIVIFQAPITKTEKQTALWTYPCLKGRMCQSFFDVYYYNKETGFNFTLPIYYGNGIEWIKFKN